MSVVEKVGIKESKELLSFLIDLAQACINAASDGQLTMGDAPGFWNALQEAPPAFSDLGKLPAELADISADEVAQLATLVVSKLTIANASVDALVKQVIKVVFEGLKIGPLVLSLKEAK